MAKISIIIPIFNIEKYLEECVESILAQTFTDFELILVDDGSSDKSVKICDNYAAKDVRIKAIHQKNSGQSVARNTGLDIATGEYCCFIDGDDIISPLYCEKLYSMLVNTEYDFSVCGVSRFQDGDAPNPDDCTGITTMSNIDFLNEQLQKRSEFGFWNKMFRRSLFEKFRFAAGRLNEDVIFSADMATLSGGAIVTSEQLYYYRQRSTGTVAIQRKKAPVDMIYAGEYLIKLSENHYPSLTDICYTYAMNYVWTFIDPIYVNRTFKNNKAFLNEMQAFLKKYISVYKQKKYYDSIKTHRMNLFAKSRFLYGFNAYARLMRVYIYRIIHKDPYKTGHGI